MRIALIQLDSVVGDLVHNAGSIRNHARAAAAQGADLAVTPELSLVGYPPRDLLLREGFVDGCAAAAGQLAARLAKDGAGNLAVLIGLPSRIAGGVTPIANACAVLRGGVVERIYAKRLLPQYDVFDEARYFSPGAENAIIDVAGRRVGLLMCEDFWRGLDVGEGDGYSIDPVALTARAGATLIVVQSASPFSVGKQSRRLELIARAAARHQIPFAFVNAAGANDDFVFDGGSCLVAPDGRGTFACRFREEVLIADTHAPTAPPAPMDMHEEIAQAITSAIGGYASKTRHPGVIIGLSGGIDSALVAALAVAALGPSRVRGVSMPGPHSSPGSLSDAAESARLLGMAPPDVLEISAAHRLLAANLSNATPVAGVTDENLQSRLRGVTLMALSNATGWLVLSTGNKSELAVGYATLYGDMCGGLAPLGDLLKTQVFALARWLNAHPAALGFSKPPIPQASIDKPPSAELRANQTDQDALPPYETLDRIVTGWVDEDLSIDAIVRTTGFDRALITRWTTAIDRAHYKRFQAPIIPKLSARAFGPGRRMPLAMQFRMVDDSPAVGS